MRNSHFRRKAAGKLAVCGRLPVRNLQKKLPYGPAKRRTDGMQRRLRDLGLIEQTRVVCLGRSPMGDPSAYLIRGSVIALRRCDCRAIRVAVL